MIRQGLCDVLLALSVLVVLVSAVGVLVMRGVYTKLHYLGPMCLVAPALIAVAVTVKSGFSENTVQTWIAMILLMISGPLLTHATIRAARIKETGDWRGPIRPGPDDFPVREGR